MNQKRNLLACLLMLAPLAAIASPNMYGDEGDIRVFSAQTMGSGKWLFGVHGMMSTDSNRLYHDSLYAVSANGLQRQGLKLDPGSGLTEATARANLAFGLSNYFDAGVSVPFYADDPTINDANLGLAGGVVNSPLKTTIKNWSYGDPMIWFKLQYPMWPHSHVFDMAFLGQFDVPLGDANKGFLPKELAYTSPDSTASSAFTSLKKQPYGRAEMLWTLDLSKIEGSHIPFEANLNYGVQAALNLKPAAENEFILAASGKFKFQMTDVMGIDLFGEYYGETRWDKLDAGYQINQDPNIFTLGMAFKYEDRRGGAYLKFGYDWGLTDTSSTIYVVRPIGTGTLEYRVRPVPANAMHVQVSAFVKTKQDRDGDGVDDDIDLCPDVKGDERYFGCPNPDLDGDGVCDAWVSEQGLSAQFAGICTGKDLCPETKGTAEFQGCPNPDSDSDRVCDPWVAEKGLLDNFIQICRGVDKCPTVPGLANNDGCPVPDQDHDGICDPWVAENHLSDKFAPICTGSDKCPTVAGKAEFFGCPSPDSDGDGVCDPWVAEAGMSETFKDKCQATDWCPDVKGDPKFHGCPNPDSDGDGLCDPWVSQKGMSDKFKDICTGVDKCPTIAGLAQFGGCPNPDADSDGVCDSWVAEKGLLATYAGVCKGVDKCDGIKGLPEFDGCPNPDSDGDHVCDPWVSEKGLLKQFASICTGIDSCPTVPGTLDNKGCPKPVVLPPKAKIVLKGVNFASGKAELLASSYAALDDVVKGLLDNPESVVEISGHTDNVGNAKKNTKLSLDRAKSVINYLLGRGVKPEQLAPPKGWGPKKPIASNKTEAGRAQNRRIEMVRIK